jgi:hypothetical protein
MKKITLFALSIVALASAASAQSIAVTDAQFTSNPDNYKGKSITVAVALRPKAIVPVATTVAVGAPSTVSTGAGSAANTVASCKKAPAGFSAIDVDFASNPKFAACFIMRKADYDNIAGQESVKASITFKGEINTFYTISLVGK